MEAFLAKVFWFLVLWIAGVATGGLILFGRWSDQDASMKLWGGWSAFWFLFLILS